MFRQMEKSMAMSDQVWVRHANPLSVYSRIPALPMLALAIWSRVWVGYGAWVLLALVIVWIWLNPRVFPVPKSLDNWASRGVLGERIWLNRRDEIARHHRVWAMGLGIAALPGLIFMSVGLWRLDWVMTVLGTALAMGPKLWFLDRMNWIYADWLAATGKELGDV